MVVSVAGSHARTTNEGEHTREDHPDPEHIRPLHASFWRALQREVKATRRQDCREAVAVGPGQRLEEGPPGRYRFEPVDDVGRLSAGDRVVVRLGEARIEGQVVRTDAALVVDLDRPLGETTPSGRIRPDSAWLTAAIRDRVAGTIQALQEGEAPAPPFHFRMGLRAIGERPVRPDEESLPEAALEGGTALNGEQRQAVRRALGNDVNYLWGPPGTGKSFTLGRIAEAHYRRNRTVLAVAASNQAVDVLVNEIAERLEEDELDRGQLLRIGPGVTDRLPEDVRHRVRPNELARRNRARQENWKDELDRRIARLKQKAGWSWRMRDGLARGLSDLLGEAVARRLESPVRRCRRHRHHLLDTPVRGPEELTAAADIIATTAHQVILNPCLDRLFDAVVIDEASMLAVPTVYLMAGRAQEHVTVAGDFHQLPPVHAGDATEEILGRDVFQRVGIPDAIDHGEEPDGLVQLRTQYRMRNEICQVANSVFYGGALRTAGEVHARPDPDGPLGGRLYYCHTAPLSPRVERVDGGSRVNGTHARVDEALLDYLLLGPDGQPDAEAGPVAVLTPFVGQRRRVMRRIRGRYPSELVPVSTIHGAQGDEYPTVILDLVDATGLPVSQYLKADRLTATGARLLNVGLTRARDQLVVVGDFKKLGRHGGRVLKQVLRTLGYAATRIRTDRILAGSKAVGT